MIRQVDTMELIYAMLNNSFGINKILKRFNFGDISLDGVTSDEINTITYVKLKQIGENKIYNETIRENFVEPENDNIFKGLNKEVHDFAEKVFGMGYSPNELIEDKSWESGMFDFIHNPANVAKMAYTLFDANQDKEVRNKVKEFLMLLTNKKYDFSVARIILFEMMKVAESTSDRQICLNASNVLSTLVEKSVESQIMKLLSENPEEASRLMKDFNISTDDLQTYIIANQRYKELLVANGINNTTSVNENNEMGE